MSELQSCGLEVLAKSGEERREDHQPPQARTVLLSGVWQKTLQDLLQNSPFCKQPSDYPWPMTLGPQATECRITSIYNVLQKTLSMQQTRTLITPTTSLLLRVFIAIGTGVNLDTVLYILFIFLFNLDIVHYFTTCNFSHCIFILFFIKQNMPQNILHFCNVYLYNNYRRLLLLWSWAMTFCWQRNDCCFVVFSSMTIKKV